MRFFLRIICSIPNNLFSLRDSVLPSQTEKGIPARNEQTDHQNTIVHDNPQQSADQLACVFKTALFLKCLLFSCWCTVSLWKWWGSAWRIPKQTTHDAKGFTIMYRAWEPGYSASHASPMVFAQRWCHSRQGIYCAGPSKGGGQKF